MMSLETDKSLNNNPLILLVTACQKEQAGYTCEAMMLNTATSYQWLGRTEPTAAWLSSSAITPTQWSAIGYSTVGSGKGKAKIVFNGQPPVKDLTRLMWMRMENRLGIILDPSTLAPAPPFFVLADPRPVYRCQVDIKLLITKASELPDLGVIEFRASRPKVNVVAQQLWEAALVTNVTVNQWLPVSLDEQNTSSFGAIFLQHRVDEETYHAQLYVTEPLNHDLVNVALYRRSTWLDGENILSKTACVATITSV